MAKTIDFNIRNIEAIELPARGRIEFKDSKVPGLYLRVTQSGMKTFSFVGRAKGSSRVERSTFGKYPAVKPEEARRRAAVLAGELAAGVSVAAVARRKRAEMTLSELGSAYIAALIKDKRKRVELVRSMWDRHILPELGAKRRLTELTKGEVDRWHDAIPLRVVREREEAKKERDARHAARRAEIDAARAIRRRGPDPKPSEDSSASTRKVTGERTANQVLESLRAAYNWAIASSDIAFAGPNPAAEIGKHDQAARTRYLKAADMPAFFAALAEEPNETIRDFVILGVLTGARRANVCAMRWENFDFDEGVWTVPGELTKNGEPYVVPLTREALALLRQRREQINGPWVFPSPRSKTGHLVEPHSGWRRILKRAGLTDLRIHDLRHTLGSWLANTNTSMPLIGRALNHKSPDATAIYAHVDVDPVRQSMDGATSAMFHAAGLKTKAKLIQMPFKGNEEQPRPQHPGAILRDDLLPELDVTFDRFARLLSISGAALNRILNEQQPLTADLAIRVAALIGGTPEEWMQAQHAVDLWDARQRSDRFTSLKPVKRSPRPAAA